MAIKAVIFDLYGTLIEIETDEGMEELWRTIAHFFTYHGVDFRRWDLKELFFDIMRKQKAASGELYAEMNMVQIWLEIMLRKEVKPPLDGRSLESIAITLTELFRGISRKRLALYQDVHSVLKKLKERFTLGMVSDAQAQFAIPEMTILGIHDFFHPIAISGDFGYRKPDPRLFIRVLDELGVNPNEAIFVGNDMFRDIFGAKQVGIATLLFKSGQGEQTYKNTEPEYIAYTFAQVLDGVNFLCEKHKWA